MHSNNQRKRKLEDDTEGSKTKTTVREKGDNNGISPDTDQVGGTVGPELPLML